MRQVDLRERSHSMTLIGKLTHHGNVHIPEVTQAWLHWLTMASYKSQKSRRHGCTGSPALFSAELYSVSAATSPSTLRLLHGHHGLQHGHECWPMRRSGGLMGKHRVQLIRGRRRQGLLRPGCPSTPSQFAPSTRTCLQQAAVMQ